MVIEYVSTELQQVFKSVLSDNFKQAELTRINHTG